MISLNKIENLNCRIKENIQKIEIYKLTSDNNKEILINHLKGEIFRLKVMLFKIKERKLIKNVNKFI